MWECVATAIDGCKTRSAFDRYNIIGVCGFLDATVRLERQFNHPETTCNKVKSLLTQILAFVSY